MQQVYCIMLVNTCDAKSVRAYFSFVIVTFFSHPQVYSITNKTLHKQMLKEKVNNRAREYANH